MISGDQVAIKVFEEDVQKTYKLIISRVKFHEENTVHTKLKGRQFNSLRKVRPFPHLPQIIIILISISFLGEGGANIGFNVPDGPPPDDLDSKVQELKI